MTPPTPPGPRVLIAGGSITGLSLALMLEQAGIDFLVLEGGPTIAPQVGAGLAFFPGGARILDQLGLFERLLSISSVFDPMYDWRPDGTQNVCVRGVSPFFDQTLGYPVLFLDRQQAVQMFYEAIRQKGKIVTDARVAHVHESTTSVTVTTTLGQSFTGTLLVGCDGVKSAVRSEMWRLGNASDPSYFGSGGPSEVRCKWRTLFGIAAVDDVPRSANITMNQDFACALMSRGHYAYLVLHEALPRTLVGDEIRPYGADAVDEVARRHWDDPIREGVTFADVYGKLTRKVLVPIQEYVLQKWHFGRVLLLGDAVHKTHPSTGQGAMLCLEDNVVFTNLLVRRLKASSSSLSHQQPQPQPLTRADCDALFAETQRRRSKRAKTVSQESFLVVGLYAWRNPVFRLMSRYILPLIMPDFILGVFMETTRPAPSLDHEYARAAMVGKKRDALVGFDDEDPEPKVPLAAMALRSITCLVLVMTLVHAVSVLPSVLPSNGTLGGVRGPQSAVDTTALGIMAVVLVEGWRRCNIVSPVRFPWIWALLMDFYGVRVVGPLYLLVDILHGVSQGRMRYAVTGHGVFISASKAMVPMLLVFGLAPVMVAWLGSSVGGMLPWSIFSSLFALPATLTAVGLSLYGFFSTDSDAVLGTRYRKHLRPGLACASAVLALLHLGARFGGLADAGLVARPVGYLHLPVLMWQLDVVADVSLWCDVKSWSLPGVLVLLGHGLIGPGASSVALWLWRDVVLNGRPAGVRVRVVKA
ncbi:Putative FAD-binding domain, FAD/NAD(P)-binding domain superfamily [Colletotrichum destructivum]|uniref:FAD-binding domain, FAD/NAD(P)-binding domain superfamily n=1 Tax=Colletotrichum destructivum TaxID=34406 RepID=A0AAX4J1F1_9PEZI|nr:Putative FAD-binding domain, FAD/NAD(P)-binding domain superfamily [Colletotrichum destructivum]